ncbi:hypothetical protein [Gemmatimonas sp.]|uniref:hypothetical protein n=1 Tax=Gemmatimonas sp. TaxID=1962908 RepID=UPI00286E3632|nr:hypothetical protein [Gemmatimonas sp.]
MPSPIRPRRGHLLIECLMALVLVAIASLVLATTSVSMATLGDDALQLARAQREQANAAGRALLAPCDTAAGGVAITRWPTARLRVDEALTSDGALHRSRVNVRWIASALATDASRELRVSSAARCR